MIPFLLATLAKGAPCPTAVPSTGWSATLGAAEEAYRAFDAERFDDTLDTAALDLRCLADVVSTGDAARYHVLSGLRQYTRARIGEAVQEFAAARAADPSFVVDETLVPIGHELRSLIPGEVTGPTAAVPPPAEGVTLAFDGTPAIERPVDRPVIVQIVSASGAPSETTYLLPGDPMPGYPVLVRAVPLLPDDAVPEGPSVTVPVPVRVTHRPRWAILGASGVAAGASAVLYGLAAGSEAKFNAELPPEYGKDELVLLRKQTNALVWSSVVAGSLAGSGLVVFAVVR